MAWDDPSPRARSRRPPAQSNNADAPISFGRLVFRMALAGIAGVLACVGAKTGLSAWHGSAARASGLDIVLTVAAGCVAAALAWKYVMNRVPQHGLGARVRDGRGWGSGSGDGGIVDNLGTAEVVADLIEVAIDVVADL